MQEDLTQQLLEWVRSHFFGKYRGIVSDTADPTERGRLKVRVPAVLGDLEVWAMPCVPYAGEGVGLYVLPNAGTGVWVEFEGGDPSYPVWTGCFWGDGQIPDDADAAVKVLKTDSGTIRIDDGNDEITIQSTGGSTVTVNGEKIRIEKAGAKITVDGSGVVSEAGSTKADVSSSAFKVNNGALEVV
ncbi:MAG: phage baseplate assembly protein V [Desulfobacterales bacterium]|nr:phage baseplate assembly protein V [Desulfobacterales bacterium]